LIDELLTHIRGRFIQISNVQCEQWSNNVLHLQISHLASCTRRNLIFVKVEDTSFARLSSLFCDLLWPNENSAGQQQPWMKSYWVGQWKPMTLVKTRKSDFCAAFAPEHALMNEICFWLH